MADIEQTLREWKFQGGPSRADRWAGEQPTAYAALRGTLLGLIWLPVLWLSVRQGITWAIWGAGVLIFAGWAAGFVAARRVTRHSAAALKKWHERSGAPS